MNADGSDPRNLTRHPLDDGGHGGRVRLVAGRSQDRLREHRDTRDKDNPELYVMNADGSGQRQADADRRRTKLCSRWSPDGRRIAFGRFPTKPRWAFFVMNADGSGVRKVTWSLPGKR